MTNNDYNCLNRYPKTLSEGGVLNYDFGIFSDFRSWEVYLIRILKIKNSM